MIGQLDGENFSRVTILSQISSRFIKNTGVESKTEKAFESNMGECLHDLSTENILSRL